MDRTLQRKKWPVTRILIWALTPVLITGLLYLGISSRASSFKTDRDKLSLGQVTYTDFQDMVTFQGTVEPIRTIQLDATEGGVVEEILAEEGMMVQQGQPLIRLSNTTLRLDFMNRETQIIEQINNLRSTRITLEQNKRQVQEQLVDIRYNLKEQLRQFHLDSTLYADRVISVIDFKASKANVQYLKEKQRLFMDRLATDEQYRKSQLNRIDASMHLMERNLEAIRRNLENLTVKAPIAGQLNSFDHEIGATKVRGENLGRIDQLSGYSVNAQVDQYYLNRLRVGQTAKVAFGNTQHPMTVDKIFPTIVNSQFEVRLAFTDTALPVNIRRGQSVRVRLELSAIQKALLVPRGSFSQSNQGQYVYVVSGNEAQRRTVQFGSQNPEWIEIKSGLEAGETIITSSYHPFGDAERIILTQN